MARRSMRGTPAATARTKKGWKTKRTESQKFQRRAKVAGRVGTAGDIVSIAGGVGALHGVSKMSKGKPVTLKRAATHLGMGIGGNLVGQVGQGAQRHYAQKAQHVINAGQQPQHYVRRPVKH